MTRIVSGLLAGVIVAVGVSACGEIDQKAKVEKVYAGKIDARPSDDPQFRGDKKKFETTLASRAKSQNEYLRIEAK